MIAANGCSRTGYRLQADREAYNVIAERNADPRWCAANYCIEMDPRSRYFDPCDPDKPPMPQDDPASHQYMHCVDGKKGWKHWHDNGFRAELENPAWRAALAEYVEIDEDGSAKLNVDSALTVDLNSRAAFQIALANRADFMNGRAALVDRWRRIQFSADALHLGLRALLRQLEQLRENIEIQRGAVAIAIRRVDLTQAELYAPVPPPRPGQRAAQFGPTAAINLLSAQSALRDTQNNFLNAWLNYYAAKMRLARELGIIMLDPDGRWLDYRYPHCEATPK